jgi:hypothetical protein
MPLRPQGIGRRELRDIAQLNRHRSVKVGPDQFVDLRDEEDREEQRPQDAAEEPGLRFSLPASDPDQRGGPDHEQREHHQV